jgi:AraC-like DNA-binding protein
MSCPVCTFLAREASVGDRVVQLALRELHHDPTRAWSVEQLARVVGSSRSSLSERFSKLVGTSPMQYLRQWRMLVAANLLASSAAPLVRVAEEVGYNNDTAFSRAFRREFGESPAAWRRRQSTLMLRRSAPGGP